MYFFSDSESHCFICLAAPAIVSSAVEIGSTECCDMYRCIVKVKVQCIPFQEEFSALSDSKANFQLTAVSLLVCVMFDFSCV